MPGPYVLQVKVTTGHFEETTRRDCIKGLLASALFTCPDLKDYPDCAHVCETRNRFSGFAHDMLQFYLFNN
jgi:hypothetical protein